MLRLMSVMIRDQEMNTSREALNFKYQLWKEWWRDDAVAVRVVININVERKKGRE